jgi:hypothetical protein
LLTTVTFEPFVLASWSIRASTVNCSRSSSVVSMMRTLEVVSTARAPSRPSGLECDRRRGGVQAIRRRILGRAIELVARDEVGGAGLQNTGRDASDIASPGGLLGASSPASTASISAHSRDPE